MEVYTYLDTMSSTSFLWSWLCKASNAIAKQSGRCLELPLPMEPNPVLGVASFLPQTLVRQQLKLPPTFFNCFFSPIFSVLLINTRIISINIPYTILDLSWTAHHRFKGEVVTKFYTSVFKALSSVYPSGQLLEKQETGGHHGPELTPSIGLSMWQTA